MRKVWLGLLYFVVNFCFLIIFFLLRIFMWFVILLIVRLLEMIFEWVRRELFFFLKLDVFELDLGEIFCSLVVLRFLVFFFWYIFGECRVFFLVLFLSFCSFLWDLEVDIRDCEFECVVGVEVRFFFIFL